MTSGNTDHYTIEDCCLDEETYLSAKHIAVMRRDRGSTLLHRQSSWKVVANERLR